MQDSCLRLWAKREIDLLPADHIVKPYAKELLAIIDQFETQTNGSGVIPCSAHLLADTIKSLCSYTALSPLTGQHDEWFHVEHEICQNVRCPGVFRDGLGRAYFLDAIVWVDDGEYFTGVVDGINSCQYIESFPFVPKIFYIEVKLVGEIYKIKNHSQLNAVYEYYDTPKPE